MMLTRKYWKTGTGFAICIGIAILSIPPPVAADDKAKTEKKADAPKPIFADKNLEAAVRRQVFSKRDNKEVITAR